jgi:uncharacterized membrane protein
VGRSSFSNGDQFATEWSDGRVIDLGPGLAYSINDAGQAVGVSDIGGFAVATEWSGGSVIDLGGLPGSTSSEALSINNTGQMVGISFVGSTQFATE